MKNQIEILKTYINSLNKNYNELTQEEKNAHYYVKKDLELTNLIKEIDQLSTKESRIALLDKYYNDKKQNVKEAVSRVYGINIESIEFLKLQSGIDVITFYDEKISRKRIIDYTYAKSLVTEFTTIQNANNNFQTNNYEQNATEIAKSEALQNEGKRELDLIGVEEFNNKYNDIINGITDPIKLQNIKKLKDTIETKHENKIKYINVDNLVALDENNNVIESYYDQKNGKSVIETPYQYKSSISEVTNEEQVKEQENEIETNENITPDYNTATNDVPLNEPSEFEQKEEIVFEEIALDNEMKLSHITKPKEEVIANIRRYTANMEELDADKAKLTEEEFNFYENIKTKYASAFNNTMKKDLALKNNANSTGFVNLIFISMLLLFLAFILFIM